MRRIVPIIGLLVFGSLTMAFVAPSSSSAEGTVKWYSWEEAVKANKTNKKKFMVDVYTDWCGWCKRMDAATFEKPEVAKYINDNFYAIKLDAEMKADIEFRGSTFVFYPNAGRKGVHSLAYSLLEGQMSYPSIVFLDENVDRIMISKGYKGPEDFLKELKYTSEEHYKTVNLDTYKAKPE